MRALFERLARELGSLRQRRVSVNHEIELVRRL